MRMIARTKLKKFYHALEFFQIIALSAPVGYGKKTFILQYFKDNPDKTYIMYHADTQFSQIELHAETEYIILDNPDFSQDCTLLEKIWEAVKGNATLHVIIITEKRLPDCIYKWQYEHIAYIIRTRSLYFDNQELTELLKANSINTGGETVDRIQNLCGGWILAIVLFLKSYDEADCRFQPNHEILRMIDIYVYQPLSVELKKQFMQLSILKSFSYEEILMQIKEKKSFHICLYLY